ncbi:MAG: hypothetical protein E7516_09245 [Ruminococcaceae bacterium]|nr:hypothetical protein [Oscillospiraceae bacterium]
MCGIIIECNDMKHLLLSENVLSDHQVFNIVSLFKDANDIDNVTEKVFDNLGISLKRIPIIAEIKKNHS